MPNLIQQSKPENKIQKQCLKKKIKTLTLRK